MPSPKHRYMARLIPTAIHNSQQYHPIKAEHSPESSPLPVGCFPDSALPIDIYSSNLSLSHSLFQVKGQQRQTNWVYVFEGKVDGGSEVLYSA